MFAAAVGIAHDELVSYAWIYASKIPSSSWLLEGLGRSTNQAWWWTAIGAHDLAVNVTLSVPFAILIVWLRKLDYWIVTVVAVVVGILWAYRLVIYQLDFSFFTSNQAVWGVVMHTLMLPLALILVVAISNKRGIT